MSSKFQVIPLGGCGEIGMNLTLWHVDDAWFFVDCGTLFADEHLPGMDLIFPSLDCLRERGIRPTAWLITHGHEDHIGALPFVYKEFSAPIYTTEFTAELIKEKFRGLELAQPEVHVWRIWNKTTFRNAAVTPFPVNHSIPDACGLYFETKYGNLLHTGDYRIDKSAPEGSVTIDNLKRITDGKQTLLMTADSTNVFVSGRDREEKQVSDSLTALFKTSRGRVVVATFASNIWRVKSAFQAARATGRKVVLLGKSLIRNYEISKRLGMIDEADEGLVVSLEELKLLQPSQICVLCTGTQGEVFSGANRLAFGSMENIRLDGDDLVILSARAIPGNEKSIGVLINQFWRLGCRVLTGKDADVHVSGHGYCEDLAECIAMVKPKMFMPLHGEFRNLVQHLRLAQSVGVPAENCHLVENGDVLTIAPEALGVTDRWDVGRDYVANERVISGSADVLKNRVMLAKNGIVEVSLLTDNGLSRILSEPKIFVRGVNTSIDRVRDAIVGCFRELQRVQRKSHWTEESLSEELRLAVRRDLESELGYKCVVSLFLHRL
ncbi:ribonuclease J [bacterium]|nr:ribonuclease J [bacterium]